MKEPYSLQHLTYAGDRVFMEEANSTVFTPGRSFGIMLNHHLFDQRMTWAFGGFQEVTDDSSFFGKKGDWDVALRLTGLPYYREEGRKLIHFGVAYVHSFRDDDATETYRQRPEANLADSLPTTGPFFDERSGHLWHRVGGQLRPLPVSAGNFRRVAQPPG